MRAWQGLMVISAAVALLVYGGLGRSETFLQGSSPNARSAILRAAPEPPKVGGVTWLLVGSDSRKGETARSDALLLARIHSSQPHVLLVSIPRDLRTEVMGYGYTKINHALAYGGMPLLKSTVEKALGLHVDHAIAVNFQGFSEFVDAIGGVKLLVNKPLDYDDATDQTHIHIRPGWQRLSGQQALDYVRFRHDALSDTGRMARQQQLLAALIRTRVPISRWQAVVGSAFRMSRDVQTDASLWTVMQVIRQLMTAPSVVVTARTLQGVNQVDPRDGLWYFYLDSHERMALGRQIGLFDRGH